METSKIVKNGFTINLRPKPTSDWTVIEEIFDTNVYHLDESRIKYGTVIDIGANIGAFTLLASQYAKVWCFEPEYHNYEILNRNMADNILTNPVFVSKFAVGKPGESTIDDLQGCSQIGKGNQKVTVIGINEILDSFDKIDYLKVDAELSEYIIFDDISEENLKKISYMGIEFHPPYDEKYEKLCKKLGKYFNTSGHFWWKKGLKGL